MSPSRLLTLTGLAVAAALCAGTAASVYASSLPRQYAFAAAHGWRAGAAPEAPELRRHAADRTQPRAARLEASTMIAAGACLNPRELLFGVQGIRYAALDSLSAVLGDLPEAAHALAAARAVLAGIDEGRPYTSDRPAPKGEPVAMVGGLSWLVPDRIQHRVTYCQALLAR